MTMREVRRVDGSADFCGINDNKTRAFIYYRGHMRAYKLYYRPERTLNDHMGNAPFGYYVMLPVYHKRKPRRVYIRY